MSYPEIKSYTAYLSGSGGAVLVELVDGSKHEVRNLGDNPLSPPEAVAAIVDILRNEKPCYFDVNNRFICTGSEPVGEAE